MIVLQESDPFESSDERFAPPGYARSTLDYGPLQLNFSWLLTTVREKPVYENNVPRLLYAMMLARLSWELTSISQHHFEEMLRLRVAASLRRSTYGGLGREELNIFKNLSSTILSITTLTSVSVFSGDIAYFSKFDEFAKISQRHERIRAATVSFAAAEEDELAKTEARRAGALNSLLAILTIVSLIGISASVISAWEQGVEMFGSVEMLLAAFFAPAALGLVALIGARR